MSLYHLGNRVTALVDGQLTPEAAERALAHAAACPECRAALDAERAARRVVRSAEDLTPSDDLTVRLLALSRPEPGSGAPVGMVAPVDVALPRGHRHVRWLVATGGAAAAAVGGLIALGGAASPVLDPAALRATVVLPDDATDHDGAVGDGADLTATALARLGAEGWVVPSVVPADLEVVGVDAEGDEVALELAGDGAHVLLTERHGRLPHVGPEAARVVVGDVEALLLDTSPWTAAVQSGDVVVVVVGESGPGAGMAVLAGLPVAAPPADDVLTRLDRGWEVVRTSVRRTLAGADASS